MSENVLSLAKRISEGDGNVSSKRVSVVQALENCLENIRQRDLKPSRVIVCLEYEDSVGPAYYAANCTFREALGVLECAKVELIRDVVEN